MIEKVISGGQTGVDQAALRAARACGIATAGYAPKGWLTEDGPAPWLADYDLVEFRSPSYPARTQANVEAAGGTLLLVTGISQTKAGGTKLTLATTRRLRKPALLIDLSWGYAVRYHAWDDWRRWLRAHAVVNVAGPRESKRPGIGAMAEALLVELLKDLEVKP